MGMELVLENRRTRESFNQSFDMESAEPLKRMCELCDNAFSQGTFIHEWRYNIKRLVRLLVQRQRRKWPLKKTWAPAQSHQMMTLKHHFPKEVDFTVCTKRC